MNKHNFAILIVFGLIVCGASLLFTSSAAHAADMTFCEENCLKINIFNDSPAVVTEVKVQQLSGANNCDEVEQVHTGNLLEFESFKVDANTHCPYYVKYVTTDGCKGDKDGKISLQDFSDHRTQLHLNGGCGTLHVTNEKPRGDQ